MTITDVFLDQKRVNVCECTVKMASHESFLKMSPAGCITRGGEEGGGKIKWKLSEVITRAVSRGRNKFIGEIKMVAGDVISIRGKLLSTHTFQHELKGS